MTTINAENNFAGHNSYHMYQVSKIQEECLIKWQCNINKNIASFSAFDDLFHHL